MREQAHIFGGEYFEDTPRDAAVSTLSVQHGDVLVLATDGVFDNLNNSEILKIVTARMLGTGAWRASSSPSPSPSEGASGSEKESGAIYASETLGALTEPGALDLGTSSSTSTTKNQNHTLQALLAASIVGEAKLASVDMRRDGPFAKEAQRYYPGHWYRGGKVDDITVVVVIAVEE
jgi:protein phosphatase PTC7